MSNEKEPIEGEVVKVEVDSSGVSAGNDSEAKQAKENTCGPKSTAKSRKSTAKRKSARKTAATKSTATASVTPSTPQQPAKEATPVLVEDTQKTEAEKVVTTSEPVETGTAKTGQEGERSTFNVTSITDTATAEVEPPKIPGSKTTEHSTLLPSAIAIVLLLGVIGFTVYKSVDFQPLTASAPATEATAADDAGAALVSTSEQQAEQSAVTSDVSEAPTHESQTSAVAGAITTAVGEPTSSEPLAGDQGGLTTSSVTDGGAPSGSTFAQAGSADSVAASNAGSANTTPEAAYTRSSIDPAVAQSNPEAGWDRVIVSFMNPFNYLQMAGYFMGSVMQAWSFPTSQPPVTH